MLFVVALVLEMPQSFVTTIHVHIIIQLNMSCDKIKLGGFKGVTPHPYCKLEHNCYKFLIIF